MTIAILSLKPRTAKEITAGCWHLTAESVSCRRLKHTTKIQSKDSAQIQTSQDYLPVFGQQAFTGGQVWATET